MQLIDVLIEAETQLDWGSDPDKVEKALIHLREIEPDDERVKALEKKLAHLRPQHVLGRIIEH